MAGVAQNGSGTQNGRLPQHDWLYGLYCMRPVECGHVQTADRLAAICSLVAVERLMTQTIKKTCRTFNSRKPEVVVICHEMDPRAGAIAAAAAGRKPPAGT
jgi:hypothetical protein